jgi:hypothetical protein
MLFYGCFNIGISGPLTQYPKTFPKFSRGAEFQPLRASYGTRLVMADPEWHRADPIVLNSNRHPTLITFVNGERLDSLCKFNEVRESGPGYVHRHPSTHWAAKTGNRIGEERCLVHMRTYVRAYTLTCTYVDSVRSLSYPRYAQGPWEPGIEARQAAWRGRRPGQGSQAAGEQDVAPAGREEELRQRWLQSGRENGGGRRRSGEGFSDRDPPGPGRGTGGVSGSRL